MVRPVERVGWGGRVPTGNTHESGAHTGERRWRSVSSLSSGATAKTLGVRQSPGW